MPATATKKKATKKPAAAKAEKPIKGDGETSSKGDKEKALVVVESPAKAKTIKKYLGAGFTVKASIGHVMDLPKSKMGVDVDNGFQPEYVIIRGKGKIIAEIKKTAKSVDVVYLAPDPDREGEAIAWPIASILPKGTKILRVAFQSITKAAVQEALDHPRNIDMDRERARVIRFGIIVLEKIHHLFDADGVDRRQQPLVDQPTHIRIGRSSSSHRRILSLPPVQFAQRASAVQLSATRSIAHRKTASAALCDKHSALRFGKR